MSKPDYIVLIQRAPWNGSPEGVFPVAFKVVGETKNSFEFERPSDDVCAEHRLSLIYPRQKTGIRTRSEGSRYDRNRPVHYYADKEIVLFHTDSAEVPAQAQEFVKAVENYKAKQVALGIAKSDAEKKFSAEKHAMQERHRKEVDALKAKETQAVVAEAEAQSAAWMAIRDCQKRLSGAATEKAA